MDRSLVHLMDHRSSRVDESVLVCPSLMLSFIGVVESYLSSNSRLEALNRDDLSLRKTVNPSVAVPSSCATGDPRKFSYVSDCAGRGGAGDASRRGCCCSKGSVMWTGV